MAALHKSGGWMTRAERREQLGAHCSQVLPSFFLPLLLFSLEDVGEEEDTLLSL